MQHQKRLPAIEVDAARLPDVLAQVATFAEIEPLADDLQTRVRHRFSSPSAVSAMARMKRRIAATSDGIGSPVHSSM